MECDWTDFQTFKHDPCDRIDAVCLKELLEQAITGMTPVDQAIEHVIDRMERQRS